jgi:hypothetical protein
MGFISRILEITKESESPERYYYWSALSSISAVVRKNVYLNRGNLYTLYPNLYVFLIGPSGIRKGPPVALAKKLVNRVQNTRVLSGRGSIQAFIKELATAYHMPDNSIITDASGFLVSGELGAFLVEDPAAYVLLTDLYDTQYNEEWKNYIKGTGTDKLKNVYLTLLGASNEVFLHDSVPKNVVGGGFIARTMVVVEEKKRRVNSLIYDVKGSIDYMSEDGNDSEDVIDIKQSVEWLRQLANLSGQFRMTPEAAKFADKWYKELNARQEKAKEKDRMGLFERLLDHALKVSMLISLSNKLELIIEEQDMKEAVAVCQECIPGTKRVFLGEGKSEIAGPTAIVLKELLRRPGHEMSRQNLLRVGWGDFDSIVLDRIITTLSEAGALKTYNKNISGKLTVMYQMPDDIVMQYRRFEEEEN